MLMGGADSQEGVGNLYGYRHRLVQERNGRADCDGGTDAKALANRRSGRWRRQKHSIQWRW